MPAHLTAAPSIANVPSAQILCAIRSLVSAASIPITLDALVQGVRRKLGFSRMGPRIHAVITAQIKIAEDRHLISRSGALVWPGYGSIFEYKITLLQECVMSVASRRPVDREAIIVAAARALGFGRTGGRIEERLKSAISGLIRRGHLEGDSRHVWKKR